MKEKYSDERTFLVSKKTEERKEHKTCFSAQDNVAVKSCLQEILDRDIYKQDFECITIPLIFEAVSYDEVKTNLQKVVDSGLFESGVDEWPPPDLATNLRSMQSFSPIATMANLPSAPPIA